MADSASSPTQAQQAVSALLSATPYITALFGAIVGYVARGLESRKAEVLARVEDAVKEIAAIQVVLTAYWSRDTSETGGNTEDLAQSAELVGRIHILNLLVEDLVGYLHASFHAELRGFVRELRQTATGFDFDPNQGHQARSLTVSNGYQTGANLTLLLRKAGRRYNRKVFGFGGN